MEALHGLNSLIVHVYYTKHYTIQFWNFWLIAVLIIRDCAAEEGSKLSVCQGLPETHMEEENEDKLRKLRENLGI